MTEKRPKPTKAGYIRTYSNGRLVMQHRQVWEKVNGPVPKGFIIHHKNHIKTDNRLENLELMDQKTHRRIHEGWVFSEGQWHKSCTDCHKRFPATPSYFFRIKNSLHGKCKSCDVTARRLRRQAA